MLAALFLFPFILTATSLEVAQEYFLDGVDIPYTSDSITITHKTKTIKVLAATVTDQDPANGAVDRLKASSDFTTQYLGKKWVMFEITGEFSVESECMPTKNGVNYYVSFKYKDSYEYDLRGIEAFRIEALTFHNNCREERGGNPLSFDAKLNKEAQKMAQQAAKEESLIQMNSDRCRWNTAVEGGFESEEDPIRSGAAMGLIRRWYKQGSKYIYNHDGIRDEDIEANVNECFNFITMMWNSTKTVGFGIAKSETCENWIKVETLYIYAVYEDPSGIRNKDSLAKNILPPPKT